jgi:hypothetical protein
MHLHLVLDFLNSLPDFGCALCFTPCAQLLWNLPQHLRQLNLQNIIWSKRSTTSLGPTLCHITVKKKIFAKHNIIFSVFKFIYLELVVLCFKQRTGIIMDVQIRLGKERICRKENLLWLQFVHFLKLIFFWKLRVVSKVWIYINWWKRRNKAATNNYSHHFILTVCK